MLLCGGVALILSGGVMLDKTDLFITGIMSATVGAILFLFGMGMML